VKYHTIIGTGYSIVRIEYTVIVVHEKVYISTLDMFVRGIGFEW